MKKLVVFALALCCAISFAGCASASVEDAARAFNGFVFDYDAQQLYISGMAQLSFGEGQSRTVLTDNMSVKLKWEGESRIGELKSSVSMGEQELMNYTLYSRDGAVFENGEDIGQSLDVLLGNSFNMQTGKDMLSKDNIKSCALENKDGCQFYNITINKDSVPESLREMLVSSGDGVLSDAVFTNDLQAEVVYKDGSPLEFTLTADMTATMMGTADTPLQAVIHTQINEFEDFVMED